ncbi:hypothetical protein CC78DRAFT_577824 [Lojkania enalia]|uniref:Uncharacterized protein n=1 Tax=Lojkania enalia TaxID=147567 RepID=A0A9P4KDY1_9PLEO|nr:hypothetical protein CC78DRAFT_577824 [Didymosphaeria enalia]
MGRQSSRTSIARHPYSLPWPFAEGVLLCLSARWIKVTTQASGTLSSSNLHLHYHHTTPQLTHPSPPPGPQLRHTIAILCLYPSRAPLPNRLRPPPIPPARASLASSTRPATLRLYLITSPAPCLRRFRTPTIGSLPLQTAVDAVEIICTARNPPPVVQFCFSCAGVCPRLLSVTRPPHHSSHTLKLGFRLAARPGHQSRVGAHTAATLVAVQARISCIACCGSSKTLSSTFWHAASQSVCEFQQTVPAP